MKNSIDHSRRIAHLSTVHSPRDNRIFHKECVSLARAGLGVTLIIPQADAPEVDKGVHIHPIPRRSNRWSRVLLGSVDAMRALGNVKPDLVHFHDPELIPAVFLWKLATRRKAIFDAHEDLPKQIDSKPYIPGYVRRVAKLAATALIRTADRGLDGVIAATPSIASTFYNSRKVVVRNFPWLEEFPEPDPVRAEKGTLVYVGGMTEERNFDLMVDIAKGVPGAKLLLAGPADDHSAKRIADHVDDPQVEYLGRLPVSEVPGIVARGELGLVLFRADPNHVEALPTKLFEYMASGVPFVASDFKFWRELLEPFDCGIFVDVSSARHSISAVNELLIDEDRRRSMGKNGRAAIVSTFNFANEAKKLVSFTKEVLDDA